MSSDSRVKIGFVQMNTAVDDSTYLPYSVALLQAYLLVRPLSVFDRAALPIEVRIAPARFTITRITDVYLARVNNPDKDFRDFLARCDAWRGPELGQLSSLL